MLHNGQVFAHFEIVRKLGEGGMGEVYLVIDQKLNRQVALKTLRSDFFDNPERRERFHREATTAASISHPNVTSIHDLGTAHDPDSKREINYIVMEYVEGTPLKEFLSSQKSDITTVLRLAEKISSGLAAAHKVNVVHRDLKPDNIIIDKNDEPKILDFGLAKAIDPLQMEGKQGDEEDTVSQELTRAGTVVGTVSYMSPEQAQGQSVDSRSDVFSFGILLYRMVTGDLPFTGSTQVSILAKILEANPEPPSAKNASVPRELERIIDKCLQKNPNDRYQDTRDLVIDLRRLRREYDSDISDTISSISTERAKAVKSRNKPFSVKKALLLTPVLFAICILVIYLFSRDKQNGITLQASESSLAILGFENKTGDSELDWLETGLPEMLLTDLARNEAVTIISQRRVLDCLGKDAKEIGQIHSHKECVEAASSLGAKTVLSGSIFKVGNLTRIDARLEDATSGKILFGEKVVGDDPIALVDSLTARLAIALDLEGLGESVTSVTTSSPEAYKYYHLGYEDLLNGLFDQAVVKLQQALEYDSTFALPYMRIGMAYAFQGRQQDGATYLALAKKYEDKLPLRERNLLDIYADFWLNTKYNDAYVKLKTFVNNYPDDKESKSMLAIIISQLTNDTTEAFILLDEVLQQDPGYQMALDWYAQVYQNLGNEEQAIEYTRRILKYHPESRSAYVRLADLYTDQLLLDDAIDTYEKILERYPQDASALFALYRIHIRKREFDKARSYLERVRHAHSDNPYRMIQYYSGLASYYNWQGKFITSMEYRFAAVESAKMSGDSSQISGYYGVISAYYDRLDMLDSTCYYAREAYKFASAFQKLDYGIILVRVDTANVSEAKPILEKAINDFRVMVPEELWGIANALEELFDATSAADTIAMIAANQKLIESQLGGSSEGNMRQLGQLKVLHGDYEEGLEILSRYVTGKDESTSGFSYPYTNYLIGIANEGLGNTAAAIESYTEMLKYWDDPEIELKEIKDARKRLASLKSQS